MVGNKSEYFGKLKSLLEEYNSVFLVSVDNVSSQQMHEYERLLPHIRGNIGFVFTNGDLKDIRDKILANKVAAPARAGAVAPADVYIPAGNTGMEPGKTSFFQALGVPTKIARGTIEITSDLKLVEAGSKVGASEATLLNMLNISPFTYGLGVEQLLKSFSSAITTIAAISLAINFPTLPSVMHSFFNSYKNLVAIAIETEYSWAAIEELKDRIANPDAYAAAAPAASSGDAGASAAAAETKKDDSEAEESDEDGGGFGDLLYVNPYLWKTIQKLTFFAAVKCFSMRTKSTIDMNLGIGRFYETLDKRKPPFHRIAKW
ncbi:60S ribosomal protein uL10 [Apiospora aurea]|uniref:Large ribosomal subunit protein uL10-like insertion domain-containing protein n=1 Tax=Apiospora aurea TaxID=335848 RepID=A0ABR1QCX3_9PEZI